MIRSEFYIASCKKDGGAYLFTLTEDGRLLRGNATIDLAEPMWTVVSDGRLCACRRGGDWEAYAEFSLATGQVLRGPIPTQGTEVCHFVRDGEDVYLANYSTGAVCHIRGSDCLLHPHEPTPDNPLGPDASRQECPHVHQCILSPDKQYVIVCDLGLDCVFVYDRDLHEISHANIPSGHGARHAVFSQDGSRLWVLGEMGGSVSEFGWTDGLLTYRYTVSILPDGYSGENGSAALILSPDGRHLYATNRGADTIAHLTVGERLTVVSQTPSMGSHPRDFRLIAGGQYAVCCDTFDDRIVLFRVGDDGELTFLTTADVPAPLCVSEL